MKKINGLLIFSLVIVLSLVVSCEQERLQEAFSPTTDEVENRNTVVISNNVLLDNDMMSFTDEFAFEDFMHYLDSVGVESFLALVNSYGFTSYCNPVTGICVNTTIGNELDEPELMSILNEYSMVHIGDHIMKLNFEEEEVYVLPDDISAIEMQQFQLAEDAQDVEAILSTPGSEYIIPFQENVFDIINGVSSGEDDPEDFRLCGDCRVERCIVPKRITYECGDSFPDSLLAQLTFEGSLDICYSAYGIWKSLEVSFSHYPVLSSSALDFLVSFSLSYEGQYRRRCKDIDPVGESVSGFAGRGGKKERIYRGTRCLSEVDIEASVEFEDICFGTERFVGPGFLLLL